MKEEYIIISLLYFFIFLMLYLLLSCVRKLSKLRSSISNPSDEIEMYSENMYLQIPTTQFSRTNYITSTQVTIVPLSSGVNYSQDDPPPTYDECVAKILDP